MEAQGVEACAVCFYPRVCIMIEEAWGNTVNAVAIISKSFLMSIFRRKGERKHETVLLI
jgi:hypothetical protein